MTGVDGSPRDDTPILPDEDLPPIVTPVRRSRGARTRLVIVAVAFAAVVAFLLVQAGKSTVYFRTVDDAVAQQRALGTKRFRIEGVVQSGTIVQGADALRFRIYGDRGAVADVVHRGGQPTGLFRDDIPVVLEGQWSRDGRTFESTRVIVKHSETYRVENPERVDDYPPGTGTGGS